MATAGEPRKLAYDWKKRTFSYRFRNDPSVKAPTEIYVPMHFGEDYTVKASAGRIEIAGTVLRYFAEASVKEAKIEISVSS